MRTTVTLADSRTIFDGLYVQYNWLTSRCTQELIKRHVVREQENSDHIRSLPNAEHNNTYRADTMHRCNHL
jgi:hypothetical protein